MTEIDRRTARSGFTWSPRHSGNRIAYALVIGWPFWLAAGRPADWLILPIAAVPWTIITVALVMIDRRRWERED